MNKSAKLQRNFNKNFLLNKKKKFNLKTKECKLSKGNI